MESLLSTLEPIYQIAEIPFGLFGVELTGWQHLAYLAALLIIVLLVLRKILRKKRFGTAHGALAESSDIDALLQSKGSFNESQQALALLRANQDQLKKTKQWDQLGQLFADANSPADSARYYMKAKMFKEAAVQYAATGNSTKAAKLMLKGGDFETGGLFYMQRANYKKAAAAFVKGGHTALAADAYAKAKNAKEAIPLFVEYFASPRGNETLLLKTAESCYELLNDEAAMSGVDPKSLAALCTNTANVFEHAEKLEIAAELYQRSGEHSRAGEVYLKAGKLEQAAASMKAAGRDKDAARIGGRFYELNKRWKEAAMAYAGAGEYTKTAECFAKAQEPVRAGEYYEKASEFARSGLAYATGKRFEKAIEVLQKVPESDKDFDVSRGILGQSFYESHDYEHCAATLDNHLMGKRIEKANVDYFYMLSLAWEQLGKLEKSKDLLYKIGSVDATYRDVDQRISQIDSRISSVESQSPAHVHAGTSSEGMNLVANTLKDRYDIESELGRGGMGVVYLAQDKQLDRKVALKFLGALVDNSEEFRQRFIREARTAAKISHPNIVAIYDISASEGKAYIAMEYVEGTSLYKFVEKKGKLKPAEAVNIMAQSCAALDAIHAAGIVHRDIKPDNIIIAKDGRVKLMDFGLAKAENNRITAANVVMGTPSYMSPEQAKGQEADGRADIYAMGLVFYEMLTGEVVFLDGDVMRRQIEEIPTPLGELVPDLPDGIEEIAHRCVAKNAADRFGTAADVVRALKKIQFT